MLRFHLILPALILFALLHAAPRGLRAEDASEARIDSMSFDDLIALVDEMDFNDPIEANHHLAIRAIEKLHDSDLTDEQRAAAYCRLAVYHLRTGDDEAALADVDAALRIDADNSELLLMKGSLLFDSGKGAEGKTFARNALLADPELVDAQQSYSKLTSRAHVAKDDWSLLRKSEPLLPVIVHPYLKSATTFFKSEDYRASLTRIEDYLRTVPYDYQHCDDVYMMFVVSSSKLPAVQGEPRVADLEIVRRAVLAWNLMKSQPHRTEVLKSMVRAVHVAYAGKSPGTVLALADTLLSQGNLRERGLASVQYVRAKAFAGLGRYSEALAAIDAALGADGSDLDSRALKVEYLTCTGQYAAALVECDGILKHNPNHVSTLLLKAQICAGCPDEKIRDPKAAVKLASQACEAAAKRNLGERFNPYKVLVLASAEAGDFESAGKAVKQLRFAADSVQDVKEVEQIADHVRDRKPWKLNAPNDNSKLAKHTLLFQQLAESLPNLQVPELQVRYEELCNELLNVKELSDQERTYSLRRRAQSRFWQGKLDPAIADIQELLQQTPKDYSICVLLNRALIEKHDEKGMAELAERLAKSGDDSQEFRWTRDVVKLETELNRIDRSAFKSPQERQELVEQTGKGIDQLIQQTPQQPILYQLRATNRLQRGDYAAAYEDSRKCLDLAPYRSRVEFANVVHQHATILEKLYRFDHALQYAAMAMRIEGETDRNKQLVASIYRAVGKPQLASFYAPNPTPAAKVQPAVAESNR